MSAKPAPVTRAPEGLAPARLLGASVLLWLSVASGCAKPAQFCSLNSDCTRGSYCTKDGCRTDCRADFDCLVGTCQLATGRCLSMGDAGVETPAADAGPDAATKPPADLSVVAGPDLAEPPALASYGDLCSAGTDCLSTICTKNPFTAEHECAGPCRGDVDCMIGDVCIASLKLCAQSDIGNSCKGAADCREGACLGGGNDGPAICTRICASAADCPSGWSCSSVSGTRVCVNVEVTSACKSSLQCWYGTTCDGTRCLGGCRNAADCPLTHVCSGNLCTPAVARGRGGNGDPCNSGDDCRSNFCAAQRCVGLCGVTLDRGQYCNGGWGCNPISDNGATRLGCVTAGVGALGDPCTDNNSCGSGLCIGGPPGVCSRFCNAAPCPSVLPKCVAAGIVADGVNLKVCTS